MKINATFYSDPGHGWLAVKRHVLEQLHLLHRISSYSYQRGATVYLEEDCDASLFLSIARHFGEVNITDKFTDKRSPIRSYDSFHP